MEAQEELALRAFLRGLHPQRLREHVWLAAPGSLAVALHEGEHAEAILAGTSTLTWTNEGVC